MGGEGRGELVLAMASEVGMDKGTCKAGLPDYPVHPDQQKCKTKKWPTMIIAG